MLSSFHNTISSQKWQQAVYMIVTGKFDPNQKGDIGLSARELACNNINKLIECKSIFGTTFETPLEECLVTANGIESIKALVALGANVNQKNEAGDNAIMVYLKTIAKSNKLPSLKIIKFLIAEGSDFTPNKKQENPLQFAKEQFGEHLSTYMVRQATPIDSKISSAIKLQRACRNLLYRKQNIEHFGNNVYGPRSVGEIIQQFPMHSKLTLQPKIPQTDNSISPSKSQEWIHLHQKEDQKLAAEVLKKIDHVSFARFLFGLKGSIEKWNTLIMSRPESQRNYALLIDSRDEKSSPWVTSLALPWLAHPPSQIVTLDENDIKLIKKDVHHLVIIDDAIYSGNQMVKTLDPILESRVLPDYQHLLSKEFHLVVPFISESGKERMSEREVNVIHQETIPNFKNEGLNIMGETATYFDHKIAQVGISTINILTTGETIRGKPGVRFIPSTKEPYKSF